LSTINQTYETVPVGELVEHPDNPRKGDLDTITDSIAHNGFYGALIVDQANQVLAGNHRLKAARELGIEKLPIIRVEVDEATAKRIMLVDNRANDQASYDQEALVRVLEGLPDIGGTGYGQDDLSKLLADLGRTIEDAPPPPDPPEEPTSEPGQLYQLGPHRLLCGDALNRDDVARLMDGTIADLVLTDPPYNVAYTGKTADALTIQNDQMGGADFEAFLLEAYTRMIEVTKPGGAIYVFHADTEGLAFRRTMIQAGWQLKQCLVWIKNIFVMGRQDYQWQHEPVLYDWAPGAAHTWLGGRTYSTTFDTRPDLRKLKKEELVEMLEALYQDTTAIFEDRPTASRLHPTMKPLPLIGRLMANSARAGEVVLDQFGGSGSTLLAADQLGMQARLIELDPAYVDVIIARWEEQTGGTAELVE